MKRYAYQQSGIAQRALGLSQPFYPIFMTCRALLGHINMQKKTTAFMSTAIGGPKGTKFDRDKSIQKLQESLRQLRGTQQVTVQDLEKMHRFCDEIIEGLFVRQPNDRHSGLILALGTIEEAIRDTQPGGGLTAHVRYQWNKLRRQLLGRVVEAFTCGKEGRLWFQKTDRKATQGKKAVTSLIRCLVCPSPTCVEEATTGDVILPSDIAAMLPDIFSSSGLADKKFGRDYMQTVLTIIAAFQEALLTNYAGYMTKQYPAMSRHEHCISVFDLWDDKLLSWCLRALSSYGMFATAFLLLQHCIHDLPACLVCSFAPKTNGSGFLMKVFASSCSLDAGKLMRSTDEEAKERASLLSSQKNLLHDQIRTTLRTKDSEAPLFAGATRSLLQLWEQGQVAEFCNQSVKLPQAISTLLLEQFAKPQKVPFAWQLYCNSSPAAVLQGLKWYATKSKDQNGMMAVEEDSPLTTRSTVPDGGFQHHIFVASTTVQYLLKEKKLQEAMWIYRQQRGNLFPGVEQTLVNELSISGTLDDVFRVLGDYIRSSTPLPSRLVRRIIIASNETISTGDGRFGIAPEEQSAMQLLSYSEGERYPWLCENNLRSTKKWMSQTINTLHDSGKRPVNEHANDISLTAREVPSDSLKVSRVGHLEATRLMLSNLDKSALANEPLGSLGVSQCLIQFATQLGHATGDWSESHRLLRNLAFNGTEAPVLKAAYICFLRSLCSEKDGHRGLFLQMLSEKVLFETPSTLASFRKTLKQTYEELGDYNCADVECEFFDALEKHIYLR
eukprot:gb/GECG01010899.1/.p1 GENE.gb/GECG01010899.1/~~gb/GECG01010899.1/.p1  ORF type:complete len:782 (+),score=88.33 gb/GECG01010899.1/:1-2346(+)